MRILPALLAASALAWGPAQASEGNAAAKELSGRVTARHQLGEHATQRYLRHGAPGPDATTAVMRLRADGDGDSAGDEPGEAGHQGMMLLVFIKFDTDRNGKLDRGEYEAAVSYLQAVAARPDPD